MPLKTNKLPMMLALQSGKLEVDCTEGSQLLTAGAIRKQQVIGDIRHDSNRLCASLPEECKRFTSLLSKSHVWCARDDQTAGNSNMVSHLTLSGTHAVARYHSNNSQTVWHHTDWWRCESNVIWEEQVVETKSSHCSQTLPVSSQHLLSALPQEYSALRWIKDWDRARACNNWWAWPTSVVKPAKRTSNIHSKAEYVDYMWNRVYKMPKGSKKASNYAVSVVCSISHLPGHVILPHPFLYKV